MIQVVVVRDIGQAMDLDAQVSGEVGPDIIDALTERADGLANRLRLLIGGRRRNDGFLRLDVGYFAFKFVNLLLQLLDLALEVANRFGRSGILGACRGPACQKHR